MPQAIGPNPRRPVPIHRLLEVFNKVLAEYGYTRQERAFLWDVARNDNPHSYACYAAIINSWGNDGANPAIRRV